MKETIEFRIPIENARKHLPAGLGVDLGGVLRVTLASEDPLIAQIKSLEHQYHAKGKTFFHGWMIRRRYSRHELDQAKLLHVWPQKTFEPAGEECGTVYDESEACDYVISRIPEWEISGYRIPESIDFCGVGAVQVTSLYLDGRRIPRNVDFTRTIAGEIAVSSRVVQVFQELGLTGAEFDPVRLVDRNHEPSQDHYQLNVVGTPVELDSVTRAGSHPFDEDAYGRCPRSHLVGLNLLSEVTVKAAKIPKNDILITRQMVGVRRGLLRPRPLLLFSPCGWLAVKKAKLKGLTVEVAHLS